MHPAAKAGLASFALGTGFLLLAAASPMGGRDSGAFWEPAFEGLGQGAAAAARAVKRAARAAGASAAAALSPTSSTQQLPQETTVAAAAAASPPAPVLAPVQAPAPAAGGAAVVPAAELEPISRGEAFSLVSRWQQIKALAMGPRHDTSLLPEVLAEPMLGLWATKAQEAGSSGVFWRYSLHDLRVISVDKGSEGGRGKVVVQLDVSCVGAVVEQPCQSLLKVHTASCLQETANLLGDTAEASDSYKSVYRVEYLVTRDPRDGDWRIFSGRIL